MRHPLGFHLLPLPPNSPLSIIQTFLSRVLIPCSEQQHVLYYARQEGSFIAIISHLAVSRVALGFAEALGTCLSTALCTMHPRAGQGHLHQHPTQGLGWALDSCCTVRSGCAAACCHRCWFSHLFLSWKYISRKNEGGHPSHIHKQRCVHWQEGNQNICSPLPSQQPTYFCFKPCLSFPGHEYPAAFSCLL